jgi:hypothetical protein
MWCSITLWIDATTVHLSIGGWRIKTVPSRLSEVDLARLALAREELLPIPQSR